MRKWSYGYVVLLRWASCSRRTAQSSAQGGNQGLFTNEQRTLACQSYVNSLYPPTTGQMDRQRGPCTRPACA